jgi:hypothetical protein
MTTSRKCRYPSRGAASISAREWSVARSMPLQSLQDLAARYRAQTPSSYRPSGTMNGMSSDQFEATMGGMMPVQNGSAEDTYAGKKWYEQQGSY